MTFTPKYGQELTQAELGAFGRFAEPVETPARVTFRREEPKRTLAEKVTNFFGMKEVADTFGGEIARANTEDPVAQANIEASAPSVRETTGSALRGVGNVLGLAVAAPASLGAKVAQGAALGYAQDVGTDLQNGRETADAVKPGLGTGVGAALPVVGAGVKKVADLIGRAGDKIQYSVIKPTKVDIDDGFSLDTIKKYNLSGGALKGGSLKTIADNTENKIQELTGALNTKLADSNSSVNLSKTYEKTAKKLLGDKFQNFGSNSQLENALEALKGEVVSSAGENGLVSVPQAQTVKRAAGHFGAWFHGAPDPESTARQTVYNAFYRTLKEDIEKASPDGVREINKQLSELIPVMNALIRRIPVAERNNALSLTDVITLTGSMLEPSALSLSILNLASKSGRVGNLLTKSGASLSDTLTSPMSELAGRVGDTIVRNELSQIGSGGKNEQ